MNGSPASLPSDSYALKVAYKVEPESNLYFIFSHYIDAQQRAWQPKDSTPDPGTFRGTMYDYRPI